MSRRTEQLIQAVNELKTVHRQWQADETGNRPHPDQAYWDAVDAFKNVFASGDIPADLRDLDRAAEKFLEQDANFDAGLNDGMPFPEFFAALEAVFACQEVDEDPDLQPLESLEELRRSMNNGNVNATAWDHQICEIYGFNDKKGRLMPHLIDKEIKTPGSVLKTPSAIDGRDWEDPRITVRRKTKPSAAATIAAKVRERGATTSTEKPCPESPRELWEQRVSVTQSAKMLLKSEDEVKKLFAGFDAELEEDVDTKVDESQSDESPIAAPSIVELWNKNTSVKTTATTLGMSVEDVKEAFEMFDMQKETGEPIGLASTNA